MKLAVQELTIAAPIEEVFALLVDPELFVCWMAEEATLDTVPGGSSTGPTPTATLAADHHELVARLQHREWWITTTTRPPATPGSS